MEELIALRLGSKDLHTLSYLYPSLRSNDFWMRKFYAAYGTRLENSNDYMLEYLVMEKLEDGDLYHYILKKRYNTLFKLLVGKVDDRETLLTKAIQYGNLEVVKYLVEQGVNIHTDNDWALVTAAANGNLEVLKYLVEKGDDIHAENDFALRYAAENGHLEVVKYLVEQGADIHVGNDHALRWAANNGHLEVVKYLIKQGADIHVGNDHALRWAANNGHLEVVKYLVDQGADMYVENDKALRWAAQNGHLEVLKYLVDKGANLEALKYNLSMYNSEISEYYQKQKALRDNKRPSEKNRCAAITLKGEQCKKNATVGKYCSIHSKNR